MAGILHVIPYFVPAYGFGGPVTACMDIAATQVRMGHRVVVATTDALDARSRVASPFEIIEGIEVVRFRNVSARLGKQRNLFLPIGLRAWVRTHLQEFAVVHLHDYFTYQNVLVSALCRRLGIPYVIQPHGVAAPPRDQRLYLVKHVFGELWGRQMLLGARKIIAVSETERARLDAYLPSHRDRIAIVSNGLRLDDPGRAPADRERFGLRAGDKVILSLGRLHETKGFDRLVRAFGRLAARDESYRLLIAGPDDGEAAALERLIAELGLGGRARLLGLVTGADKDAVFAVADVFALLSRYESFSIAVIEALHRGLPVCLSAEVGVAAEIRDKGCAVLATHPDDADESAADLARTYAARAELAAHARATAARYDIRTVTRALEVHYGLTDPAVASVGP